MKKLTIMLLHLQFPARAGVVSGLVLLLTLATPWLMAQSDDFNDGNDAGWAHYALPFYGTPTYSFPSDGSSGKAYRIYAPPTGTDAYGLRNARAGSFQATTPYSGRFSVASDLLAWNANWRQEAGLIFFFQDVGLGTSDGYTATYSSAYRTMYISRILDEAPITVAQLTDGSVVADQTHTYRMVVSSHGGGTYLFQMFDKADPNNPWATVIGQDFTYGAGIMGYMVFQQTYPSTTEGADATFDNYAASVPAAGSLPAVVTDLVPPSSGKATAFYPTVTVGILDRDTTVDTTSIVLCMDGAWIPNASLTSVETQVHKPSNPDAFLNDFGGATATYSNNVLYPWGSKHTNIVAFKDSNNVWFTNTWSWTTAYPYLFSSNSLPVGSLSVRGFDARMVQSDNGGVNLDNSLARARQQLAIPPTIAINRTATNIIQVLDWNKTGTPNNVPGLCSPSSLNNIAVQSYAYLELSAGLHRFHIKSDDRSGLYSGSSLADPLAQTLWENSGSTADTTFEFAVEAPGLYPISCLWEETGGSAVLSLKSVDLNDLSEVTVNDPSDPAGVVKAWYPLVCKSAESVSGPYTVASTAVNALTSVDVVGSDCSPTVVGQMVSGGTFTVPISGSARFYVIDGPRKTKITNIGKGASEVVISYQVQ